MSDTRNPDDYYGPNDTIEPMHFGAARELWDALDITRDPWTPPSESRCRWLFRGMRDAELELLPPAWRRAGREFEVIDAAKGEIERRGLLSDGVPEPQAWRIQRAAECTLLHDFIEEASAIGLPLPPDTPPQRTLRVPYANHEVVALAQHHGVPSSLLDFTTDPLVAMFWASEAPLQEAEHLAIWALRRPTRGTIGWEIHEHSRARNRHLFAQDAVAIHMTQGDEAIRADNPLPALETCGFVPKDSLKKLILPRSEVPALRRLLDLRGVTHAKLMPGYDGVARTVIARYS